MKHNIEVTSATNINQSCIIDGNNYEFNFDHSDLVNSIMNNNNISDLEQLSSLDSSDYTKKEMSEQIAYEWDFNDVTSLIEDFVNCYPDKLIDHLTVNAN